MEVTYFEMYVKRNQFLLTCLSVDQRLRLHDERKQALPRWFGSHECGAQVRRRRRIHTSTSASESWGTPSESCCARLVSTNSTSPNFSGSIGDRSKRASHRRVKVTFKADAALFLACKANCGLTKMAIWRARSVACRTIWC